MWSRHDIKVPFAPERDRRIDLIRSIAVLGMIFVNTKYLFSAQNYGDDWLTFLSGFLDGRPAALFIVLAGIGVSLMVHSGKSRTDLKSCRAKLLKRAVVLFIAGLVLLKYWTADILHFYGIYLLSAAGISLLIIAGCCGLSEKRMNNRWLVTICDAGRMSLSIYIIHIMVCGKYIEIKDILESDYAVSQSIFIAALWCVGAMAAARMWLKRFSYGPLEWGLRAISKARVGGEQLHQGI